MRLYENDWINICMYISWIAYHEEWKIFKLSHCSPWYDLAHLIWAHIWKVMHWVASQQGYSTHASPVFAHHSSFPHLGIGDFLSKGYFHVLQNIFEKDWLLRKKMCRSDLLPEITFWSSTHLLFLNFFSQLIVICVFDFFCIDSSLILLRPWGGNCLVW